MSPASAGIYGLSAPEMRVLGCLLEKQRTTPDIYPLSLNSLRLACNQATNRDPVVDYDEATIRDALHRLERRRLVRFASGSRAAKYRHLLDEALPLDEGERALMTALMLRGAQTPGELKQRSERMHAFGDLTGVHETLERLIERELVSRLDRRAGQKEERYAQVLEEEEGAGTDDDARGVGDAAGGDAVPTRGGERAGANAGGAVLMASGGPVSRPEGDESRVGGGALEQLRERVERLERELAELRSALGR